MTLLAHLNPPQLAAVTLPCEHALVLAGAGSGKTRVLTTRIAWLIANGRVGPQGILAVTFTNKAAREMQARLAALLPIYTRSMWIGTFHGLCNRFLRAHHQEAGLPQSFQILDTSDQLASIKRLMKSLNIDEQVCPPRELMHFINAHKEQGIRAAQAEAYDHYTSRRVAWYAEYERQCQREGAVDFAELLLRSYELLQRNEPLCRHYQERFRHILVDEFQDTNRLQYAWLKRLAGHIGTDTASGGACLFAVGDDDQSIYSFRGAQIGNMNDLQREFAPVHVIRLEQNYRSHGNILDAANALIKQNRNRLGKNLWTDAGAGEPIRLFEAVSDMEEARMICDEISELVRHGADRDQIAILYRSNAQSRVLEHQLVSAGMAYRVHGGLRFFDRQEVRHALAYLRLLANPDDDTAFARVVNFPPRGIGTRTLEFLQECVQRNPSSFYNSAATLPGKAGTALARFVALIERLRDETRELPLPARVERVIDGSGLRQHYQTEKDGRDRLENLDELVNAAATFVAEAVTRETTGEMPPEPGQLASFLAHASLEAGEHQAAGSEAAVQLMTVHAAKGLEFNIVFISGLEQGLFPHESATQEPGGLEEERRLMYVAVTRARKRLYLSHAQTRLLHGQTRYCVPSSFISELPENLLHRVGRRDPAARHPLPFAGTGTGHRPPPQLGSSLRIGQNVQHPRFGLGVIVSAQGFGAESKVQVNFGAYGMKWLALAHAPLTPA